MGGRCSACLEVWASGCVYIADPFKKLGYKHWRVLLIWSQGMYMTDGEVHEVLISSLPVHVHVFICCIKWFAQLLEKPFPYEILEGVPLSLSLSSVVPYLPCFVVLVIILAVQIHGSYALCMMLFNCCVREEGKSKQSWGEMRKEGWISMLHTSRPSHMVDLSRVTSHWGEYLRKLNSCLYRFISIIWKIYWKTKFLGQDCCYLCLMQPISWRHRADWLD